MASTTILNAASLISKFEDNNGFPKDSLLNAALMESELNPAAKNKSTGASGLIQILPSKLAEWGYSASQVRTMSVSQQLPLVARYFQPYLAKLSMFEDPFEYYCAIFYPVAIGKPDSYVIAKAGTAVYNQNKGYAQNGAITKGSIRNSFYNAVAKKRNALGLESSTGKKNNTASNSGNVLTGIVNNLRFFFTGIH